MRLALKIDVDTYRGTRDGVPRLLALLERAGVHATFLFSLGPDHTGRAIRRVFRRGFAAKVARTSVLSHYGLVTLLYGTLLPGPDIARRCAATLRAVVAAGHEAGIHTYDHVEWQDRVSAADAAWTERHLRLAVSRFEEAFGVPAHVHGAAGWQMNVHALRLLDALCFRYASDTRGTHPFLPVRGGEHFTCPQLPTTLPTLDELIGRDGVSEANVARQLLDLSQKPALCGHVYTLHAELEGGKLAGAFQQLLAGWRAQGYQLGTLRDYFADLDPARLPRHEVSDGTVPGRSGTLAVQGEAA